MKQDNGNGFYSELAVLMGLVIIVTALSMFCFGSGVKYCDGKFYLDRTNTADKCPVQKP